MVVKTKFVSRETYNKELGIIFRYSRANIYSYHSLIGALYTDIKTSTIPIFIPKPEFFFNEINRLLVIENFKKLIIGLSINSFQYDNYKDKIHKLNKHPHRDRLILIAGGPHPSARPNDLLNLGIDVVVIGEGEKTFKELVEKIVNNKPFYDNKGIAYKNENNEIILQQKNDPINLDSYPPFAPQYELYSALEITRGCNHNCKYCQVPNLFGKPVRYRSPENIIEWGKFLLSKRDNWDFRFISPNAFGYGSKKSSEPNIDSIFKLLSGLKKLEAKKRKRIFFGTFPSEIRPESVTEDTLSITREFCDNNNLTMGAQTGSPRIMKIINRGHSVDQAIEAVELAKKYGFIMNVDVILGYPEENEEDQELTLKLCEKLIALGSKIHMHYLIPLPGTKYDGITPKEIAPDILKILRKWSNDDIIFGSWQHQYEKVRKNFNE
ncbi:MAG: TIGR04013 family B12-binding domain/radical SAM domain-containing protein [Asgard group archaeon]|nr:TIGR04013 family B12-binding domain/radical SAM domain-containing protein [Asgard group archaeon]